MGVASGCGEQEVGVASGSGWNLWVWLLGVVVRRYIDFLILLIPTALVSVLFAAASLLFVHFVKCFSFLYIYIHISIFTHISSKRRHSYYLFQLYRNAATIRGRLLFEVQTSRLLFISALPQCGDYSRAATIQGVPFIQGNTVYIM